MERKKEWLCNLPYIPSPTPHPTFFIWTPQIFSFKYHQVERLSCVLFLNKGKSQQLWAQLALYYQQEPTFLKSKWVNDHKSHVTKLLGGTQALFVQRTYVLSLSLRYFPFFYLKPELGHRFSQSTIKIWYKRTSCREQIFIQLALELVSFVLSSLAQESKAKFAHGISGFEVTLKYSYNIFIASEIKLS